MLRFSHLTTAAHQNRIAVMQIGPDVVPQKAPIFFSHPINLRKECWLDMIRELAVDRLCVAVDFAGHGESADAAEYGIRVWVQDCVDVIDALGLERLHVVGGSLGGPISVAIAAERPDAVLSVTSLGGRLAPDPVEAAKAPDVIGMMAERGRDAMFADVARAALAPGSSQELVDTVYYLLNSHPAETIREIWAATSTSDASGWAAKVSCPALIVNGEFDETCTPAMGRVLAEAVSGRFVEMSGVGHLPALENCAGTLELLASHLVDAELSAGVR